MNARLKPRRNSAKDIRPYRSEKRNLSRGLRVRRVVQQNTVPIVLYFASSPRFPGDRSTGAACPPRIFPVPLRLCVFHDETAKLTLRGFARPSDAVRKEANKNYRRYCRTLSLVSRDFTKSCRAISHVVELIGFERVLYARARSGSWNYRDRTDFSFSGSSFRRSRTSESNAFVLWCFRTLRIKSSGAGRQKSLEENGVYSVKLDVRANCRRWFWDRVRIFRCNAARLRAIGLKDQLLSHTYSDLWNRYFAENLDWCFDECLSWYLAWYWVEYLALYSIKYLARYFIEYQ